MAETKKTDTNETQEAAGKSTSVSAASTTQQASSVEPVLAGTKEDNSEERKLHDERSERWKRQLKNEQEALEIKHEEVPDPYAAVAGPDARLVPHEGVLKTGKVPLPPGHKLNPPGSIPRAPGEWPTAALPPENPRGKHMVSEERPSGEPAHVQAEKKAEARAIKSQAEEGKQPGVITGSEEEKEAKEEARKEVAKTSDKK